jgi:hypothetical protein
MENVTLLTWFLPAYSCGDVMKLQIRVDENGIIKEAKFKTFGCGSAIASSSYMTELVTGMSIHDAGKIKNTEIAKELCLPPVKLHCSSMLIVPFSWYYCYFCYPRHASFPWLTSAFPLVLAEDAIRSAIKDYQTKRSRLNLSLTPEVSTSTAAAAA